MAAISTLLRSPSRGSDHELSYASPLVIRMAGDQPDRESLERHNSKRRSGSFNDEDGKLGDDGRKRRSLGSSDDEGGLTSDNLHNEDLRVGGPYLCSIPTKNVAIPARHPEFQLTSMETPEGMALAQQITTILDQFQLKQTGVRFLFIGRRSIIDPEPQACLTLFVPAEREQVDDTWLKCARKLRSLLIQNELESCSVEIADNMAFTPTNTYPILHTDDVFWNWEPLLQELLAQLDLKSIIFIGCYRRGRSTTVLDCPPTLLILVDRKKDWTVTREKVISILKSRRLQMLAVEIVKDRPVTRGYREGISPGLLKGFMEKKDRTMAGDSIASSQNHYGSGTLGCFLKLRSPSSDDWRTFALTCWHVVVPSYAGLSDDDQKLIENWNKNGIPASIAKTDDVRRLLLVDHATRLAYQEEVEKIEETIQEIKDGKMFKMFKDLELRDALEMLTPQQCQNYNEDKSELKKHEENLRILHERFKNDDQVLGTVSLAPGSNGIKYFTSLDWALVHLSSHRQPSNKFDERPSLPDEFASAAILQSLELHEAEVSHHGYRTRNNTGIYSGLRVASIAAQINEKNTIRIPTLEYSVLGVNGQPFALQGDSGAMVSYKRKVEEGSQRVIVGMVFAGFEKENITRITRSDILLKDIMDTVGAKEAEIFV
ncbi:hypothetical protein N7493_007265 [Penicillium malachiteum]|uniref:Uncharacterized protein n=1 Tax=Penicillium malachiteum TaxID=1324776 RepID=A0AAD6HJA7_9EURO|nr:hypothetical protein N7493_007265 [Penicillium malachiteum]